MVILFVRLNVFSVFLLVSHVFKSKKSYISQRDRFGRPCVEPDQLSRADSCFPLKNRRCSGRGAQRRCTCDHGSRTSHTSGHTGCKVNRTQEVCQEWSRNRLQMPKASKLFLDKLPRKRWGFLLTCWHEKKHKLSSCHYQSNDSKLTICYQDPSRWSSLVHWSPDELLPCTSPHFWLFSRQHGLLPCKQKQLRKLKSHVKDCCAEFEVPKG